MIATYPEREGRDKLVGSAPKRRRYSSSDRVAGTAPRSLSMWWPAEPVDHPGLQTEPSRGGFGCAARSVTRAASLPLGVWVHFSPVPAHMEGVAVEWNDLAEHIEVYDSSGRQHRMGEHSGTNRPRLTAGARARAPHSRGSVVEWRFMGRTSTNRRAACCHMARPRLRSDLVAWRPKRQPPESHESWRRCGGH